MTEAPEVEECRVDFGEAVLRRDPHAVDGWLLTVDGTAQSYLDRADPTRLEVDYVRRMAWILDVHLAAGAPLRGVFLGCGLGALPRSVATTRPGSRLLAVDADAALVQWTRERFGTDGFALCHGDAAQVLAMEPDGSADAVVVDCYVGHEIPSSVTSAAFVQDVRRVIGDRGIAVANISDARPFDRVRHQVRSWSSVFGEVVAIADRSLVERGMSGNVVLVGSARPVDLAALTVAVRSDPARPLVLTGSAVADWLDPA